MQNKPCSRFQVFHILNQFDIPIGVARAEAANGNVHTDYTMFATVRDPQHLRYYFKSYDDQTIKMVDLNAFDLNAQSIQKISTAGKQPIVDVSDAVEAIAI